ncbi:hypothetical protein RJ639_035211 [Escallonia herrerae]|uniref:F-box associated beta-propeller type 3 domain-containing protein n=1 Tax=Escallonia herrerae TaxID=1293975 RepID=A0AA88WQ00_9ASTE|nr:hypothetical protein RJ639_035211 [Escallonia herrerae]
MQSSAGEEEREMMATTRTRNSFIPDEILVSHILPRLDAQSLARFMSTSTHWHSTISAPSFVLSHLSHSLHSRPGANLTLLLNISKPSTSAYLIYSATIPTTKHPLIEPVAAQRNPSFPSFSYVSSHISQSIHGLIFLGLSGVSGPREWICNPTTRRSIDLPLPPPFSGPFGACHYSFSFGFDPARNQHKVLLVVLFIPSAGYEMVVEYWIFTLIGGGEWRPVSCPIKGYYSVSMGTYINGSIYWWTSPGREYQVRRTHVLEFDVGSEEFRLVELPDEAQCREEEECSLVEIDGHLGIIDCREFEYGGNGIKIWVLEDNSNWVKRSMMFPIPDWGDIQDPPRLWYKGTTYTGEMMFAPRVSAANSAQAFSSYREEYTTIDDAKRVKVIEVVEGGFLNLGFNQLRFCFDILEKGGNSSSKEPSNMIFGKTFPLMLHLLRKEFGEAR